MLLERTKSELRRLDLRPKKGLGQHFLVDEVALERIASAAALTSNDVVVEVGPGLGILTRVLARDAGRVIAVEIDGRMLPALESNLAPFPNVSVLNDDILECEPASLAGGTSYKVVAALPYNIASAVIRHFLEAEAKPQLMVVVLQREVAQAIAAVQGKMGLVSVGVQFYGQPSIAGYISARGFYPSPKVESAILRIDVYDRPPVEVADEADFFNLVRGGFCAPRKQLHNSLARGLEMTTSEAAALLEGVGIDPKRRAETLSLDEWAAILRWFDDKRC